MRAAKSTIVVQFSQRTCGVAFVAHKSYVIGVKPLYAFQATMTAITSHFLVDRFSLALRLNIGLDQWKHAKGNLFFKRMTRISKNGGKCTIIAGRCVEFCAHDQRGSAYGCSTDVIDHVTFVVCGKEKT